MEQFFNYELWGNNVSDYLYALAVLILSVLASQVMKKLFVNKLQNLEGEGILGTKFLIRSISRFIIPIFYLGGLYLAMNFVDTNETVSQVIKVVYLLIVVWIVIKFARAVIEFIVTKYSQEADTEEDVKRFRPLIAFINFSFYVIGLLFILDNLGFELTAMITTLGIGGIAIALAAQAILGDLFSYFVIYFDKPFELGDFVLFDDKVGVVEKIGIKSTRIKTLRGELLVTSNSNLTNARLHNFKQMQRRRVQFNLGVTYQTRAAELEEIPKIIKRIIDEAELATYDRSHFFSYGDFSLNFETIYYVESNDYIKYMDVQQKINLSIYKEFEERGIQFAYPTRTIYMNQQKEN